MVGTIDRIRRSFIALTTPAHTAKVRASPRKKPAALVYGLEDTPPAEVVWISAVQHVGVFAIFMFYPLIVARQAGLAADEITNILQLGLLVLAFGVLLQALARGPVGCGLLAPSIFTGIYLAPTLLAVDIGGMPLVWGMTMFAGAVEMALSRLWSRLRPFIPPEAAGLVVFLVGTTIALAALRLLLQASPAGALSARNSIVAALAFSVMAALNIWNNGRLKLFCILIGTVAGYFASVAAGLLTLEDFTDVLNRPLIALPTLSRVGWSFDPSLIVPFAVSALAAAMNSTAVVTTYQRLTDAEWVRPDMMSIGRAVLGDGIATTISGLFGTYGITVSSANVGLVAATGVASRAIAPAIAAILICAALQPALIGLLTIMPRPVMAAAMLFTAAFIMINGVQIISTRLLDSRRTLVIGMGMIAFFVVSVYPAALAGAPQWTQPLVNSPLVLATLVALSLNCVFRIGLRRKLETTFDQRHGNVQEVADFIERSAATWGARRDVTSRVEFAVQQSIEAIVSFCQPAGPIRLAVSFDEFVIDAVLTYAGEALEFPLQPPTQDEILESPEGARRLAGFLVRRYADRVVASNRERQATVRLQFDH
ncbi:MAG TPA: solute carrier family 23 protein [Xanthobacteraceae bacterium]